MFLWRLLVRGDIVALLRADRISSSFNYFEGNYFEGLNYNVVLIDFCNGNHSIHQWKISIVLCCDSFI